MSVEGVLLSFLIYTLVLIAAGAFAWRWISKRLDDCDSMCEFRNDSARHAILDRATAAHIHEYAALEHEHPHDHPHNHEHLQHTHRLDPLSHHDQNGRRVDVRRCIDCHTIFQDPAAV